MKQVLSTVVTNNEIMPGTHLIWLESPQIAAEAKPGQFVMVSCGKDTLLRRPLSVHQVDKEKIALLFAIVGKGTGWLSQRQIGDTIDIFGPLGNGFSINPDSSNLLLVAGGIGISPIRFLADKAIEQGKRAELYMGATSSVHLLPTESSSQGLLTDGVLPWRITIHNIHKSTDDGSEGYEGLVTQLLVEEKLVDWADQIFACGPVAMYRDMANQYPQLKSKPPVQVSLEIMMGCGRGVCYGCTVRTKTGLKQICQDGPVFNLDDILWDELSENR